MKQKETDSPYISIIIPIFNSEKYLVECLDSVVNQATGENIEIILIDDGSTDKSGSICDDYAKMDLRVKVIHTNHNGVSAARNKGIKVAQGEWIVFLDSDDWLEDNYFTVIKQTMGSE